MAESPNPIKDPEAEAIELQAALKAVGESLRTVVAKVYGVKLTFGQFKPFIGIRRVCGDQCPPVVDIGASELPLCGLTRCAAGDKCEA